MNLKLKLATIAASLFIGSVASAYESEIYCTDMIHARASLAGAQRVVEKDGRLFNRIEGIREVIKNALVYRHCNLQNVNNIAYKTRVKVGPLLFKCPQEVAVVGYVEQTLESLNESTYGIYGGFRQGAIERTTSLLEDLKTGLSTDPACK